MTTTYEPHYSTHPYTGEAEWGWWRVLRAGAAAHYPTAPTEGAACYLPRNLYVRLSGGRHLTLGYPLWRCYATREEAMADLQTALSKAV